MTGQDGAPKHLLRLASFPHFSYLPQFVAQARGYFAGEGLEITLVTHTSQWAKLIEAIGDGVADLIVGNIWFALQETRQPHVLLPVAHCMQQSRHLICRRAGSDAGPFDWSQLEGASIFVPTDVPTPWIALRQVLAVHGVSLDRLRVVVGYSAREAADDLLQGTADFALLDPERGAWDGVEELAELAPSIGPIPWSVFMASRTDMEARPEAYRGFQRAIDRALAWMQANTSETLAETVAPWFPDTDRATAVRIIDRYRSLDAWPVRSDLPPEQLERWQGMMVRWGLLPERVPADHLLDVINAPR